MGITLGQLYTDTKDKFKLEVLAGTEAMFNNEVSRLYYMEDIYISDWTRSGELIITTAISAMKEGWLHDFVESLLPYKPSGIVINIGGYISEIPKDIVEYCEEIGMPLLTFPWEIFLQDVMQELTNRIFTAVQIETNVENAILNAIFTPESKSEYQSCLDRYGYGDYNKFTVATMKISESDYKTKAEYVIRRMQNFGNKVIGSILEEEMIVVFCQIETDKIKKIMEEVINDFVKRFGDEEVYAGVGFSVKTYYELYESFNKARDCRRYAARTHKNILLFQEMGIEGILLTSDKQLMKEYMNKKLGLLIEYDKSNSSDCILTLESFIRCAGNVSEVARDLFIHRNTVNYRVKKIKEILGIELDSMKDMVEYQIAFYILNLMD